MSAPPSSQSQVGPELTATPETAHGEERFFARRQAEAPARGSPTAAASGKVFAIERWLLGSLLRRIGRPPISIVLWDGREIRVGGSPPIARVTFHDRRALWAVAFDPDLYFGDGYSDGRIEVEGDLGGLLAAVFRATALAGKSPLSLAGRLVKRLRHAASNTMTRSRKNVHHHYDIGDDFYRLWLDDEMLYTCAYFPDPDATLEAAQRAKMDHVCRKLWLRPGEEVVEAGCGWGALALHMARHYGVSVRAYNISRNQVAYARRRAKAEGLDGRVEFIEDDYRSVRGTCDAFVSVGMLEHVGRDHYRDLGRVIDRCLRPEGRGLVHSIGRDRPMEMDRWIAKRIFPGAYPPALGEMVGLLESFGLSALDVENLRLHYALTLDHWLARFEKARDQVRRMFDDRFVRMWRLYLTGSRTGFTTGSLQLFQIVFTRTGVNAIPWTRAGLYAATNGP